MLPRSYLYVPGDRREWMSKALDRGADAIVLDLEDSVVEQRKEEARHQVRDFLAGLADQPRRTGWPQLWVRVNADTAEMAATDVAAVAGAALTGIFLPSVDLDNLAAVDQALSDVERDEALAPGMLAVVGLVETANTVLSLREVAQGPRLLRLGIGEADLAGELGLEPDEQRTELWSVRTAVVLASAAAALSRPVGPVHTNLGDPDGLRLSTMTQRRQGFRARTAVHPSQLATINDVFTPSQAEIDAARRLLAEVDDAAAVGRGAIWSHDGRMQDAATVRSAREVLHQAREERT